MIGLQVYTTMMRWLRLKPRGFVSMRREVHTLQLGHIPALLSFLKIFFAGRKAGHESYV